MIVRWYMALSEFSFTLEFIPGVDNNIADAMSRLCRNNMVDEPKEYTEEHTLSAISASTNQTRFKIQRSASCTNLKLATLDLNVHKEVSRN